MKFIAGFAAGALTCALVIFLVDLISAMPAGEIRASIGG